jgi:drug/metabolite transporter (DMT)-like permease
LGLASAIAFVALYGAIARLGSSRSAIAAMLEPVTTVLLAAWLLNEALSWRIAAGAALVVSALPVLALTARGTNAPPHT